MIRKKIRIGELLVQHEVISEEQLQSALAEQKKTGLKLGRQLIEAGYVDEDRFLDFLSKQLDIPCIDLGNADPDPETVRLLPEKDARRFRALVLEKRDRDLLVAMADPTNIFAVDEISQILKRGVRPAVARESEILRTIDLVYRRTEEITSFAEELRDEIGESDFDLSQLDSRVEESDAPVVKLLSSILEDAVQVNASDIHIEPDETVLRVRQRVDGVLQEHVMNETRIASALVLRLKLMSGLNISEKRLPQDGRFNVRAMGRSIDVRVSTMPVQHGESVVMRLLDQSQGTLELDRIGMPPKILRRFRSHVHKPHGLVLVTGPTGSGKTTTLYSVLSELNAPEKKMITVEDPVEYRLPRVNQVQINAKIGLTFASVLRAALRQDPDIVMIGEMRDQETAEIGLRAAMTGHLVFSTLHTNDAASTASRLLDMGVEGFLVATALRAVLAQRLVRRICQSCSAESQPTEQQLSGVRQLVGAKADKIVFRAGPGCQRCNGTGYRGRIGVYELLEIDGAMADALRANDPAAYTRAAHGVPGFRRLSHCALQYAAAGHTTLDEVFRVAGELDDGGPAATPAAETPAAG